MQAVPSPNDRTSYQPLAYLEDCFLVRTLWVDADSERRRMVNPRKAYPVDSGLMPLVDAAGEYPSATKRILTLNRPGALQNIPEDVMVQPALDGIIVFSSISVQELALRLRMRPKKGKAAPEPGSGRSIHVMRSYYLRTL
jgi:hypothetical protein